MQIKTEIKDICLNGGDIERMVAAMAQQIVQGEGAAASPVLVVKCQDVVYIRG